MGTYNFVFIILNVLSPAISDISQFLVQFTSKSILQLIAFLKIYKNYLNVLVEQLFVDFFFF